MGVTFLDSAVDAVNRQVYTFASFDLGTASDDRYILVSVFYDGAGSRPISGVTVDGETATMLGTEENIGGAYWYMFLVNVPAANGTTGDIVVSIQNGTTNRCGIGVWHLTGYEPTPRDFISDSADAEVTNPFDIDAVEDGAVIVLATVEQTTGSVAFDLNGTVTEDFDEVLEGSIYHAGAHEDAISADDPTYSVNLTYGVNTIARSGYVAVSFDPIAADDPAFVPKIGMFT